MANNIAELFSLQGLKVTVIATTNATITLQAKSPRRTATCPGCGQRVYRVHQRRQRTVNHGQLNDKLILVKVAVQRFFCKQCGHTFTERLTGISRRLSTDHCLAHQLQDVATMSIKGAAARHYRAWGSIAGLLDDIHYQINWPKQGKEISLGLDEHSLRKRRQMVTTITNLTKSKRNLLTILPNDKQSTIVKFLKQCPTERIVEVCIDMRASFRAAIEEALPHTNIVADPFHVVKLAGEKMEEVRAVVVSDAKHYPKVKRVLRTPQEKLTDEDKVKLTKLWQLTAAWPQLKVAWQVKEKIRDVYRSKNRASAEKKFTLILAYLEGIESRPLVTLRKTLISWQSYILNHFDRGTSNGFTEGCHTKVKMLKRISYGFQNRERYKTKILLGFHPVSELIGTTIN